MGPTTAKGYGHQHQRLRREVAAVVASGQVPCSRCGGVILPWQAWDLDHTDDRRGYRGAAHSSCNRSAGAARGNRMRRERLSDEQRAIAWAAQYEADMAHLERERRPTPRIY